MQHLTPVEKVLDRLGDYKSLREREFRARCPNHNGTSDNSLSIKEGDEGRILLHCFSGCDLEEILGALGLGASDLFERKKAPALKKKPRVPPAKPAAKKPAASEAAAPKRKEGEEGAITTDELPGGETYYGFTNIAGEVVYAQRHKKEYYRKVGDDLWKKGLEGVEQVPYNLHDLVRGIQEGKLVLHLEGLKDVETAREKLPKGSLVATSTGGVTSWRSRYAPLYAGARVTIIPDNDRPGLEYATRVAEDIHTVARWVKIVELPGAREGGGDLTDWLEDGHTAKELAEVIKGAPVFSPEDETPWPDPRGLDVSLPPVEPFSAGMLPPPLGEHAVEAARRMDAIAPDFVAAPLLVAAGTVLGRKVAIRPKARDDWEVVPNLWGANIGQPSSGKTPGQKAGLKPLEHLNTEARRAFEQRAREHGLDKIERQQREADLRSKLKEAVKNNNPAHVARAREELLAMEEVKDPTVPRLTTSDATIERLAELLIENPNGILNARDELSGWLKQLEKGGHEGDRAFFIESWDGLVPYEVDRIGRGSIYVPALCLSIFGGIQPGPLMRYVGDALEEGEKADGLLQRFQVLVWPDPRPYNRSDEAPIPATRDAVMKVFRGLRDLDVEGFGAKVETIRTEDGEEVQLGLPYLRFSADAQAIYDQWRDGFEPEVRSGAYPAAAESHFIKYRSLFPTLALIFEAMEYVSTGGHQGRGEVSAKNAARAQLWCEYLKGHALRLYHPAIVAPAVAAQALLDKIEAGSVKHRTKVRELHRKQWEGLRTPETVDEAIGVLEAHGWVRRKEVRSEGRGRPSEIILLHPDLRGE